MNNEVITLPSTATAQEAAKLMQEDEIGSIIIVDPNDKYKPIGILTERDMSNRVVAENKLASKVKCLDIMSSPLKSISPTKTLTDAMHQMASQHIKRLIVMEHESRKMVGIISQSDILEIAPYLIEVLQEIADAAKTDYKTEYFAGYCDECENWSDLLAELDHRFICPDCIQDVKAEKTEF